MQGYARAAGDGALVATVHDVIVHPKFQRRGLGRALLQRLLAQVSPTILANRNLFETLIFKTSSYCAAGLCVLLLTTVLLYLMGTVPSCAVTLSGHHRYWANFSSLHGTLLFEDIFWSRPGEFRTIAACTM